MRTVLVALVAQIAASVLCMGALWPEAPQLATADLINTECQQATRKGPPDRVWVDNDWHAGDVVATNFVEIRAMEGKRVRLSGVLHLEPGFSGMFASWATGDHQPEHAVSQGTGHPPVE